MTAFRVTPAELMELSRQVHGTAGSIEAELGGLREMHRSGMRMATVQYDASNRAAHDLYGGLGFGKIAETLGSRRPA